MDNGILDQIKSRIYEVLEKSCNFIEFYFSMNSETVGKLTIKRTALSNNINRINAEDLTDGTYLFNYTEDNKTFRFYFDEYSIIGK